jgi:hypothetical protein
MRGVDAVEVLVSLKYDGSVVGVLRDRDGHVWLSTSLERVAGNGISDYRPGHQRLDGDRTLIGGRLAPGAVAAEVIDDAGRSHSAAASNDAWVAVLEQPIGFPISPVCCRDVRGAPVAPELPEAWPRSVVSDAHEPCPACGEVAWDQVRPCDESRGARAKPDGSWEPAPFVVCRRCGHEETIGSFIRLEDPDDQDPAEVARRVRATEQAMRRQNRAQLATVDFPVYAADGWPATLAGLGGPSSGLGCAIDEVERVTVAQAGPAYEPGPALEITTSVSSGHSSNEFVLARRAFEHWLYAELPPPAIERSDAGLTVAWRTQDRRRRQLIASATRTECALPIDGRPQTFTLLTAGRRWVALRHATAHTITIAANEIDPGTISLRPVSNPRHELIADPPG